MARSPLEVFQHHARAREPVTWTDLETTPTRVFLHADGINGAEDASAMLHQAAGHVPNATGAATQSTTATCSSWSGTSCVPPRPRIEDVIDTSSSGTHSGCQTVPVHAAAPRARPAV